MNILNLFKKHKSKDLSKLEHIPQLGDAIIYHNTEPNFISDGIEWFTDGTTSHVDMYVGGGEGYIIGFTEKGCTLRKLSEYAKDCHEITVRRIKGITVTQAAKMKEVAYRDLTEKQPYDFASYLGFIIINLLRKIGINLEHKDNPVRGIGKVCSTAYDAWAKEVGLDLFPHIGDKLVTPEHILKSDKLETLIKI